MDLLNNKVLIEKCSIEYNIGKIKERFSNTEGSSYLSNGCIHCSALMGNFYLRQDLLEFQVHDELPSPICNFRIEYQELNKYFTRPLFFNRDYSYQFSK